MESWQLEFEWLRVRHWIKDRFDRKELPDLNAVLYLIGIQELGRAQEKFTKEEKQDLMHIATCSALSRSGYYQLQGLDQDGWPHWELLNKLPPLSLKEQDLLLKQAAIDYLDL